MLLIGVCAIESGFVVVQRQCEIIQVILLNNEVVVCPLAFVDISS